MINDGESTENEDDENGTDYDSKSMMSIISTRTFIRSYGAIPV